MDFRNSPCTCANPHKWVINPIDHHTKFLNSRPLHAKNADEVLNAVHNYCLSHGYPKKILTDNGGEFCNAKLKSVSDNNRITMCHGSPRTPTTQGLVERSNTCRTWKQDLRNIKMASSDKNLERWCNCTMEATYTINITFHRAILGSALDVVTDHHALEPIFNNPRSNPPTRIQRWMMKLQLYNFQIIYQKG